jgi:putative membrane protein
MLRIALAVLHLLALGVGLGAVYARARALGAVSATPDALRRAFAADAWWGIAALLWVSTGLWRAFGGTEKSPDYYWSNHVFYAKMGLFLLVFVLELWPMTTLIRWRRAAARGTLGPVEALVGTGRKLARVSDVQTLLLVAIVLSAVLMARGYGSR